MTSLAAIFLIWDETLVLKGIACIFDVGEVEML